MSSPGINTGLNLQRNYSFTFFTLTGSGPFTVIPDPITLIQNSVNFSFNYTVTNNVNNNITLQFYNLSQNSIAQFVGQNNRRGFVFNAWYGNPDIAPLGNITIFKGLVYTVSTYREGPDVITEVVGCDMFLNLMASGISESFPAFTPYLTIIQTLLAKYGDVVSLDPVSYEYLTGSYKTYKTYTGQLFTIINKIAADAGLIFSVQQNVIRMIPQYLTVVTTNDFQTITDSNGLVGYPRAISLSVQLFPVTFFGGGVNLNQNLSLLCVTTLLRPYTLYSTVFLDSEFFTGYYGILNMTQNGEWRGNPWYSTLTLWPNTTAG